MTTMAEMVSNNYQIFNRFNADKKQELIDTVNYIRMVASTTATPIAHWDIRELFGVRAEGTNELITDKREINRRFWKQVDVDKEAAPPEPPPASVAELTEAFTAKLADISRRKLERARASMQSEVDRYNREAREHVARFERAAQEAYKASERLAQSTGEPLDLSAEFAEIARSGFYQLQLDQCTDTVLTFHTPPVTMDYVQRDAATPPPVELGSYRVTFNIDNSALRVLRLESNRVSHGHYHPFISSDGDVCWGNNSNEAATLREQHRWAALFTLLANLLQRFDTTSSPYIGLDTLSQAPQRVPRTGSAAGGCPECGSGSYDESEDDDGYYYVCTECGYDWE